MDLGEAWAAVARFQERSLATTAALHGEAQEAALVREFLAQTPVAAVFACLQDASDREDDKQVKQACACIARVLSASSDGAALFFQPEIAPFILAGLQHDEKQAQVLTLDQFVLHLGKSPRLQDVAVVCEPAILAQLCAIVADEDLEVASKAMKVLEKIASVPGSELYKVVLDSLRTSSSASDIDGTSVEFMRYMETIVNVCSQGDDRMQYGVACRAVDVVLHCLKSQDPLFLMNVVDLLPRLCNTATGVEHIFQSGTLRLLLTMTEDPFIGDNVVRLVGEISSSAAKHRISSFSWSDPGILNAFLGTVDGKLQSTDAIQQIAAIDAIAAFASSSEKELDQLLRNQGICELWLQLGASTKLPVKANCLHSIARILEGPTAVKLAQNEVPVENAGIWSLLEKLFTGLGVACRKQSTMTLLMELLRQPFEELRTAVFAVLRAVAAQNNEWGMRALLSYGGFFEFLLDRTTEPTKETREWKFAILDAVMASPFQSRLDAVTLDKLRASMRRGPYAGAAPAGAELEAA